jgi:hypothetical protein
MEGRLITRPYYLTKTDKAARPQKQSISVFDRIGNQHTYTLFCCFVAIIGGVNAQFEFE